MIISELYLDSGLEDLDLDLEDLVSEDLDLD